MTGQNITPLLNPPLKTFLNYRGLILVVVISFFSDQNLFHQK